MKMQSRNVFFGLSIMALFVITTISSCSKHTDPTPIQGGGNTPPPTPPSTPTSYSDFTGPLKSFSSHLGFMTGMAITANYYPSQAQYAQVVNSECDIVTFGNEMKYGSIVQTDGSYNFTAADVLFNAATTNNLKVYGHTLGWHQQQTTAYLNSLVSPTTVLPTQLLPQGSADFENGLDSWTRLNPGSSNTTVTISADNNSTDAHTGNGCMEVVNPTAFSNSWNVQVASALVDTKVGTQYIFSYWVKATTDGGIIRLSTQDGTNTSNDNSQYQSNQTIGTSWQQVTWAFTAKSAQTRITIDMGLVANTYYIDDASFNEISTSTIDNSTIVNNLTNALQSWISNIVGRYAGKVVAWDVINELFSDGDGSIRTNSNTTASTGVFVWSNYLGENYGVTAFNAAHEADPNALLFINDYNLESNSQKLNSLITYVKWLQSQNVPIHGIGTQMHISINTSQSGIDNAFKQMAATGLLVRISELDIVINTSKTSNFTATTDQLTQQAAMYNYVVNSYIKNVPASQRYAITVWGVHDPDSWITNDAPLLFDANYQKKSAYAGFVQALKAN